MATHFHLALTETTVLRDAAMQIHAKMRGELGVFAILYGGGYDTHCRQITRLHRKSLHHKLTSRPTTLDTI
jgi:hypothetical protein